MPDPKPGEMVKVTLKNGETVEGTVEWADGNGAWIKNPQKSRWIPIEAFAPPAEPATSKKEAAEE